MTMPAPPPVLARLSAVLPPSRWELFSHADESYYLADDPLLARRLEQRIDALDTPIVARRQDAVTDLYFEAERHRASTFSDLRIRRYCNDERSPVWVIVKLGETYPQGRAQRRVLVLEYEASTTGRVEEAVVEALGLTPSFRVDKSRTKWTLLGPRMFDGAVAMGSSIRATLDHIDAIITPSGSDITGRIPSPSIVEFERPVVGWRDEDDRAYAEIRAEILAGVPVSALVPKAASKFRHLAKPSPSSSHAPTGFITEGVAPPQGHQLVVWTDPVDASVFIDRPPPHTLPTATEVRVLDGVLSYTTFPASGDDGPLQCRHHDRGASFVVPAGVPHELVPAHPETRALIGALTPDARRPAPPMPHAPSLGVGQP